MDKIINFLKDAKLKLLLLILPSIIIFYCGGYAWLTVFLSVFAILENNSFQIFGTLLSSNKNKPIYKLFLFIFLIFFTTLIFGWIINNGRLDFNRLLQFNYNGDIGIKSIIPPLLLFALSYKKIPVSATFILLSGFATKNTVDSMITKTAASYLLSFIIGYYIWYVLDKKFNDKISEFDEKRTFFWNNVQLISNVILIIFWIMSNNGGLIVSLPRNFNMLNFLVYLLFCAISISYIVFSRGGKLQKSIMNAKKGLNNPKTNSIINIIFSLIIFVFQHISSTPVATTWSFIGLLSGRELALSMKKNGYISKTTILKILKDLSVLIYGLIVTFVYIFIFKFI